MTQDEFSIFATWFTVSFFAIFAGKVIFGAVQYLRRYWKSLPDSVEFVAVEPPPRPRKVVCRDDIKTGDLIFETDDATAVFSFEACLDYGARRFASPREFLYWCWQNGVWPAETTLKSNADYYGLNPLVPNGAATIFFRSVGIDVDKKDSE